MYKNTYRLCEAVADIVHNFSQPEFAGQMPEDSREFVRICIEWAAEFEALHADGIEEDYIGKIDDFFLLKISNYKS